MTFDPPIAERVRKIALLLAAVLLLSAVSHCFWPSDPVERGRRLLERHEAELNELVEAYRRGQLPDRLDLGSPIPAGCQGMPKCKMAASVAFEKMRTLGILSIEERVRCGRDRCEVGFIFERCCILFADTYEELLYAENSDWGYFKVKPVPGFDRWYEHSGG